MSAESLDNSLPYQEKQIEFLFDQYYSRLCYYSFKIIHDTEASKDIVQDVFLKCWKTLLELNDVTASKNLLYLSVRNACLNHLRHEGVEKRYADLQSVDQDTVEEIGLNDIIRSEVIAEIKKAIETLPEGCKTVIKLSFITGLKNEEIANEMGISINTVKSQKQRALKLLRLKLDLNSFLVLLSMLP